MEWTLFRLSGITFIETPLRSVSKNALRYRLNSYALESDTAYVLQAVAIDTIGDQQLNNSALALLNVVEGDVIAQITGGSTRRASVEDVIILSAAESYDDDVDVAAGEDAGLAYEWNCSNLGDGGSDCGIIYNGFTEAILEIEPATLAAGTYTFWVEVTANDGRRNATASQVLELSAAATPVVEITSFVTSVRAASKLTIEAEIASASTATEATTVTSSWDLVEGDLAQGRSLEDVVRTSLSITRVLSLSGVYTHDIVLGESSLVAGGRYVFQLDASSAGFESAGSATIEVNVVSPPSSGVLQVSPQSGIAFFDVFEFHALRWVGDELPLKYRFETENDVILRKSSLDNALTDARLPVPNDPPNMEVTVFVTDAVEASASTFVEVLVYANSTEGLVIATLDALEVAFANYSLDSVCQVVSASASTAEDNAELLDTLVVALNQSFELFGDDDREISEQIIAALLAPTADPPLLFFDTAFDALEVAKTVTSILVQVGLGVTESTAPDVVATVLSNLLESSLFENATANTTTNATGRSSLDATNTLLETIDAIALAQRNTLVENEDGESFNSKNVRGASRLFSSALGDTMQTVESATMNASANVTTVDGVVYEAFVAEFEVNPRGDGTGEVARSQVVRFNFNTSSTSSNSNNASGGGEETVVDLTIPGSEWLGRETNESRSLNVSAECSIENSGKSRGAEYSTLAEIKDISERYTPAFLTSPKIDESALVLIALGVLIGVVIFAHFFGQYLDRRARGGSLPMMQSNPWHRIRSFPRRMQSPPFLPTRHPRSVSSPQTTAMVRIKRIMTRRHPIINFLFEYNPEIPRSVRAWKFGLEIGIFFVAMGLENILENPNVNCESRKTHRECRQPKSLGTRRRLCSWNECSLPACYEDEAGNQAANSTEHFIVLMIVMVVLLPFLALLDFLFEHYLLAPCPPRLRYWCNFFFPVEGSNGDAGATTDFQQAAEDERRREERRRQAERDGDEIYYAGALDGDERYRDDSKRDDDPVDAVAVQHSATSSILDENTVLVYPGEPEDEDKASPRIAREVSDGVQEDKDSRDVIVDAAAAAADDEANQIQTRPRGDSEEVDVEVNYMPRKRDARKARGADPVALRQAQMMDGVTPYARMTRQITRRLPSNRSALWVSDLPTLVTEIVSRLRVVDDDEDVPEPSSREIGSWWLLSVSGVQDAISAGVRSLGSSRRSASRGQQQVQQESQQRQGEQQARGFFLFASAKRSRGLRKNRRIQIQTLAMHVQQAILRRQTELRTCMAEARRLPDARISARAILILRRLEVGMLRRWRWVPSKNLWLANIHVRIERHIDEAFRLKDELEEIRGFDHETTRDLREEKLLEAEKNSKLSLTEKKIYERTMTRALWQKSPPTEPPRLACYLLAWFVIALLVAGIVVLSMQVATNIGKGQSKLWLIGLTTAIFLFYCVILPSEILWFDYVLPSLLSEKIRQLADPTKLRRFPFKTKLPDSPTFYLVIMAPHLYSDTEIGKYVIEGSVGATTDTTTTEFYENELEVIHRDSTWRARLGTQLGLFISAWLRAWLVRVPDAFHELFFEELLITAVIFSKVLGNLPSWVGNSEGDNGEVLAMAVVILVFFAIVVVMTLMYTLCNCFERLVLRGEMREPRIDVA
ncbi:hypothetical protein CTAYLR_007860 [Chrysophaeum taylorii]|uniref:PKD/REJ-like domain-containing protein n=1 Tax=Chrysophaeum taylorii TaxID=2483200 RepID=A0AAD7UES5_9STRA|nr:hypothetical protein CTAYLR_007860 [Chrysophaeum taylorii]